MSIEAMKQWLEVLELAKRSYGVMLLSDPPQDAWKTRGVNGEIDKSITSLRQAIAEAEKQEQGQPLEYWNAVEGWVKLDEVRENFDSVSCGTIYKNGGEGRVPLCLAQPKQEQGEPVAWLHTKIEGVTVTHRPADLDKYPNRWEALYKTPPTCPTCEALSRTVMLDQTSHDTTPQQRTWVDLTDDEMVSLRSRVQEYTSLDNVRYGEVIQRAMAQVLKEKNT